jgi:hypothetical protein
MNERIFSLVKAVEPRIAKIFTNLEFHIQAIYVDAVLFTLRWERLRESIYEKFRANFFKLLCLLLLYFMAFNKLSHKT